MDFVLALRITHITFTISRKTHFLICDMTDYYFQTTLFYPAFMVIAGSIL